jgi:hypothetical protein
MKLYHGQEVMTALDDIGLTILAYNDGERAYDNAPMWLVKVTFEGRTETFSSFATPLNNPLSEECIDFGILADGIVTDYRIGQCDWDCFVSKFGQRRALWVRYRELRRKLIKLFGNHLNAFVDRTERTNW